MSEERKQEGQGSTGKKKNNRPRWFHKKNKNKNGQPQNQQRGQQDQSARSGQDRGRQHQQRRQQQNQQRDGEIQGMPMQMVDGKLRRRDKLVSVFNIQQVMDKSQADSKKEILRLKQEKKSCALCNQEIEDMLSAVGHSEGDGWCHFECVQKELAKVETLAENEKIVYVGNGDFCIVQERRNRGKMYYFLRKRIHWRESEKSKKI